MQSAKEKLHKLYRLYEKPMYHIAYAVLHHTQQTEDAVSEAFCKVIRHLDQIDEPESPRTRQYMIQIIRNTAISQYRKNAKEADRRTAWDERILQVPDETPTSAAEQQEEQEYQQAILAEMLKFLVKPTGRSCCCVVSRNFPFGRLPNGAALRKQQHVSVLNVPEKP